MKLLLIFCMCAVAVKAVSEYNTHSKLFAADDSEEAHSSMQDYARCFQVHNIDPEKNFAAIFSTKKQLKNLIKNLGEYKGGCLRACLSHDATWRNRDGTINVDILLENEHISTLPEKYADTVRSIDTCKNDAEGDECNFYSCLEKRVEF